MVLRTVDERLRADVLRLAPAPGQARFSGVAADTLPAAERHPTRQPVAILRDGTPVGFFALDPADDICAYVAPAAGLALRAFFVAAPLQRQGIAAAALAALPRFARRHHPTADTLVLTVNVANPAAVALYRGAGWQDTGRLHLLGSAGPQHVMVQALGPPVLEGD